MMVQSNSVTITVVQSEGWQGSGYYDFYNSAGTPTHSGVAVEDETDFNTLLQDYGSGSYGVFIQAF